MTEEVCKFCGGTGVVPVPVEEQVGNQKVAHPPAYRRCKCSLHKDIIANVERGMPGLFAAPKVKNSSFLEYVNRNLWVTAPVNTPWFRAHLRHVAIRQPPSWYFKVISDVDIMTAWLGSVAVEGKEILDPDAAIVSSKHLTLVDLVVPPQLLIIRLGVKAARNVAAPEVLLETLNYRSHLNLPTWIWDQPSYRLDMDGHICYDDAVGDCIASWPHIVKDGGHKARVAAEGGYVDMPLENPSAASARPRKTMSDIQAQSKKGTEEAE